MEQKSHHRWTTFCFFSMGFWIGASSLTIAWMATEDILSGTKWPTTIVLVSFSITDIVSRFLGPPIVRRIPHLCSMIVLTVLLSGSLLIIVLIENVGVRLLGVAVLGCSLGFGSVVCLSMVSYYENADDLGSAVQLGMNTSALLGSLVYGVLTTWLCVAPRTAVAVLLPFSLMPNFFYALLNKETILSSCKSNAMKHQDIKYKALKDQQPKETCATVLFKLLKIFPFLMFAYMGNLSIQLSMTAVLSTLTFPNSPFPPRDHYQYYRVFNELGYIMGGSAPVLGSCLFPHWSEFFKVRKLWILTSLNVGCLIVYLSASWYRFLPNIYILLVLVFVHGIIQGSVSVNSVGGAASVFTEAEDKAIAMVAASGSLSFGRLIAGFLGLFVEKYLRQHCTSNLLLGKFCLARHVSQRGWSANGC